jgi:hypothetical protein
MQRSAWTPEGCLRLAFERLLHGDSRRGRKTHRSAEACAVVVASQQKYQFDNMQQISQAVQFGSRICLTFVQACFWQGLAIFDSIVGFNLCSNVDPTPSPPACLDSRFLVSGCLVAHRRKLGFIWVDRRWGETPCVLQLGKLAETLLPLTSHWVHDNSSWRRLSWQEFKARRPNQVVGSSRGEVCFMF